MNSSIIDFGSKIHTKIIDNDTGKIIKFVKSAEYNREMRNKSYQTEAVKNKQLKSQFMKRLEKLELNSKVLRASVIRHDLKATDIKPLYDRLVKQYEHDYDKKVILKERFNTIVNCIIKVQSQI